ncbi:MAG: DUF1573 domain-containing protein [Nibricoccus sp.]
MVEPADVDLGRRPQNVVVETKVALLNSGKETVTIYDVQADCSCTAGTPGKQSLAPGEKTEMTIRSETRSYQGEITRRVVLRTSAGDVAVPVKVTVSPYDHWELRPAFLTFEPSVKGKTVGGEVTVTHLGNEAVQITGVDAAPDWVWSVVSRSEGKNFVLALTKKPDAPAGHHMVKVTLTTTDAVNPQVSFNVFMSVTSAVQVKPSPLVMPVAKVGKEVRLKAELLGWEGNVPPRLELLDGTATVVASEAKGITFEIAITPEKAGALTRLLRVYAGEQLEAEVPVILRAE